MPGVDFDRQVEDLTYVEHLIASSPVLQATKHHVYTSGQEVWVEVEGSQREARAWRHAIDGRMFPSSIDRHGVLRQQILSTRVSVLVVQHPQQTSDGVSSLPGSALEKRRPVEDRPAETPSEPTNEGET